MSYNNLLRLGFYSWTMTDHPDACFRNDPGALGLLGARGKEELSRLFEYDLLLERPGDPLTLAERRALLRSPCVIALGPNKRDTVHGRLSEITHVDGTRGASHRYRAKLVPWVSLLDQGKRSAIYQKQSIPQIIEEIFKKYGLGKTDYRLGLDDAGRSPVHDYIVQYRESDWAFIQRWLEREGYFYWFEHNAGTCLVIADNNDDATDNTNTPPVYQYRERNNLQSDGVPTLWDFRVTNRRVQESVTMVDYNYRSPHLLLVASSPVDSKGFGRIYEFGEHFKDEATGLAWAQTRAEELAMHETTVTGTTDSKTLRAGHVFLFKNHDYMAEYEGRYLVTKIEIDVGYDPADSERGDFEASSPDVAGYKARFQAIPEQVAFRPDRRTPWPRVDGFMVGHIEADSKGEYAQLDDQGRYKVKLPFDVSTTKGLGASRWIRMAQPYGGTHYGIHHPLHKGTEVLIAHLDGDPDRPVIVGSVSNPLTPSVVNGHNATQSVTETASGIRIEYEDLEPHVTRDAPPPEKPETLVLKAPDFVIASDSTRVATRPRLMR